MSEEINPEVNDKIITSDVPQPAEAESAVVGKVEPESVKEEPKEEPVIVKDESAPEVNEETESEKEEPEPEKEEPELEKEETEIDLSDKTLAELSEMFQQLASSEDRMRRNKEAESIKSAFYKRLIKEKVDAGGSVSAEPPAGDDRENPFDAIENGFKAYYNAFRKERAEFNKQVEQDREANLAKKQAVIDDLKALLEKQEDVNVTFPAFREIQNRWREIGPVPVQNYRDINDTYQFHVEQFYDKVKINHDLRDLDFKKNLEAKQAFCEEAEKLSENDNVVAAFRELQKLHEQWKEFGPVAKEFRDSIWDRFKAATAVINKKYQDFFETQKEKQVENLAAKTVLCEQAEVIAVKEIASSNDWNASTKEIMDLQKAWKEIGYATKKENQKIYERFRAASDKFFERKREFYASYKDVMGDNLSKKMSIIEQAEALKGSTEWKKTTDLLINLQKQWKEVGAVPRKKSELLWKRFRAACDAFFNERDKQNKPENDFRTNLAAKRSLIEEIKAYETTGADSEAMSGFTQKWQAIGFVPFKEKDAINDAYKEAMKAKFPSFSFSAQRSAGPQSSSPRNEKDRLVVRFNKLQQDIDTYENNIGFFEKSKNAAPLIQQMTQRIEEAKKELLELKEQIRKAEETSAQSK